MDRDKELELLLGVGERIRKHRDEKVDAFIKLCRLEYEVLPKIETIPRSLYNVLTDTLPPKAV